MAELLITILVLLSLSAFFSGMEIAFVSSNKLLFELDRRRHSMTSWIIALFYKHREQYITTMLVGNNIVLVVYSLKMAELLEPYLRMLLDNDMFVTICQTIVATVIVLFTGEFVPKTIFMNAPNMWLKIFAVPTYLFYLILYPIAKSCSWLSLMILKLFRLDKDNSAETEQLNKTDLDYLLQENMENGDGEGDMDQEVKILQNALDFPEVKLRDCEVPRTEIVACDRNELDLEVLKQLFTQTGFSKILVYKKSIDNIVGYIHSQVIFQAPKDLSKCIRPLPIVPEMMPASRLLKLFMKEKKNIAVVVDEFGGTAGIVTLEDLLEEIFGEIEDEHDNPSREARKINDSEYVLSGRLNIDAVNEKFGLELPESDDYQTIAGLILFEYNNFPKVNEVVKVGNYSFTILKANKHLIELVRLKVE